MPVTVTAGAVTDVGEIKIDPKRSDSPRIFSGASVCAMSRRADGTRCD